MGEVKTKKRPGLLKGILNFAFLILVVFFLRWVVFEFFMIPSGSMYPKLFVSDYIWVSKHDYGLRVPFTQKWLFGPSGATRNSIIVFRSPDDTKYYIKRLVGEPEDKLLIYKDFILSVNGTKLEHKILSSQEKADLALKMKRAESSFLAYYEIYKDERRIILTPPDLKPPYDLEPQDLKALTDSYEVPKGYLLFMGDNRSQSYDGRFFGYLPYENLIGRARRIVLSCEQKKAVNSGCDLRNLRFDRLGRTLAY